MALVKIVTVFLLASILVFFSTQAKAAPPPAMSRAECMLIADMVLVARAMHLNGVSPPVAMQVMKDVYEVAIKGDRGRDAAHWVDSSLKMVTKHELGDISAVEASAAVAQGCIQLQGNLDPIFGTSL
jgi:hypothetical protein